MRNVGYHPMSSGDKPIIGIDFSDLLGTASISGTPTCTGVNCTATYVSHTAAGIVSVQVSNPTSTYSGAVQVQVTLTDGRTPGREVSLRFL